MADRRCACHSHRKEKRCCGPFHAGKLPDTPTQLMRSRFAAYARGLYDYIIETTDPEGPRWVADRAAWVASMEQFTAMTRFAGLRIVEAEGDTVTFHAVLEQMGQDASFTERSVFVQRDGRWLYHSGDPTSPAPR
ncbi:MAG: zinc chelation protein SecC [Proteobacteria bacterium]|nr:zinc chelation protein SecC [Pseudomonadota bacterium]MCP4918724.1 zinc chelation protein SecC [Pseudomonadota bacterium]